MTCPILLIITPDPAVAQEALACVEGGSTLVRVRETVSSARNDLSGIDGIALVMLEAGPSAGDALEAVGCLRSHKRGVDLPLLLLYPAGTEDEALASGMDAGADACIVRPLRCSTVRAWVHMAERLNGLTRSANGAAKGTVERVTEPLLRSASLAHAVSGPLQNISAAIDLVELALPSEFDELGQIQTVRLNVQRAAEIVRTASEEARLALRRVNGDG